VLQLLELEIQVADAAVVAEADARLVAAAAAPPAAAPATTTPARLSAVAPPVASQQEVEVARVRQLLADMQRQPMQDKEHARLAQVAAALAAQQAATSAAAMALAVQADLQAQLDAAMAAASPPTEMIQTEIDFSSPNTVSQEIYERTFDDVTPDTLPAPKMPNGNELQAASRAHALLETWVFAGGNYIFDFTTFDECAELGGSALGLFTTFLSEAIVSKWYENKPCGTDLVPKQMAQLLYMNLSRIRDVLATQQGVKEKVKADFFRLGKGKHKRRRTLVANAAVIDASDSDTAGAGSGA
jgi:hypothetical protein